MKRFILILIAFSFALNCASQNNYSVIKVSGNITIHDAEEYLKTGSVFEENDELDFITENARAAVIHPSKGRFILKQNNSDIAYARANLTPSKSNISSRAGAIMNQLDLVNYFNDKNVIIDETYLKINQISFKMDNDNFFFIRYVYKNEVINKKLSFKNDTLIINKSELFKIDGVPIENPNISRMDLFYVSQEKGGVSKICTCDFLFVNSYELLNEINIILEYMNANSSQNKIEEVANYINEMYGKINKSNVKIWLEKNNKI